MMNVFAEGQEYRVVLKSVPPQATEAATAELMLLFPMDRAPAAQIVQAAPIVLLDKLSATQAANVDSNLGCLRALGVDIAVTSEAATFGRVNWPVMPDITKHAGNVFICPHCGQRLAVHPFGETAALPAPAVVQPVPATPIKPQGLPVLQPITPPSPQSAPQPAAPVQPPGRWSLVPDDADDDVLELVDEPAKEEPQPALQPRPVLQPRQAVQPKPPVQPKPAVQPVRPAVQPGPAAQAARPAAVQPKPAVQPAKPVVQPVQAAPQAKAAEPKEQEIKILEDAKPAASTKSVLQKGIRVSFVAKLKPVQKQPVAEVIARYQGIPIEEALQLTGKSVVTVMRSATKEQAEECRKELKALGIPVQLHER